MTTEDFAVQLMWLLIFLMIFVGSLCLLDVLFRPRPRRPRDFRMPLDFKDHQRRIEENGRRVLMGRRS